MFKKLLLISILLTLSVFLFGCGEEILTTTTTTAADTTTTTTTTSSTTTTTTTTSTTTTTVVYNLNSLLDGTVLSMEYLNDNLYIATNTKLYKVSKSNPTTSAIAPVSIPANLISLYRDASNGVTFNFIGAFADNNNAYGYDESLSLNYTQALGATVPAAASTSALYYTIISNNSAIKNHWDSAANGGLGEMVTDNIYAISETGIISLCSDGSTTYYACNPTTIYKYNSDFSSVTSATLPQASTLVGIAFDGTYIWIIDSNKNLYLLAGF